MSITLSTARAAVAKRTGPHHSGTVTTALAASTAVIDTGIEDEFYDDDDLNGEWIQITSEKNDTSQKRIEDHTGAGGILAVHGDVYTTDSADLATYEITRFKGDDIKDALNNSMSSQYDRIWNEYIDSTLLTRVNQVRYTKPSGITDIFRIFIEEPINPEFDENILYNEGASVTFEAWEESTYPDGASTPVNITCSKYGGVDQQEEWVPVQDGNYIMKMVTSGSAGYVPWSIDDPTYYAGQRVVVSVKAYCLTASEFTVKVDDGVGTSESSSHGGTGMEYIRVSHDMADVPTEFTVTVESAGNTVVGYAFHIIVSRAEYYPEEVWTPVAGWAEFESLIEFNRKLTAGRVMRVIGKKTLTAFTTHTSTTELDEPQAQILYWAAVKELFEQKMFSLVHHDNNPYISKLEWAEYKLAESRKFGMVRPPIDRTPVM